MRYQNGKRYYTMSQHCRERFGGRIIKLPLCSGFSCPNRDGNLSTGGCAFCTGDGGGEFAPRQPLPLKTQYLDALDKADKWRDAFRVAYFQSFSNTYAPPERLESMLNETLALPQLAGIRIATRADCIDERRADILARFAEKTVLEVELGLQTVHDATAAKLNRCHSFEDFLLGYGLLKERGIYTCVHLINGLPDEDKAMMLDSVKALGRLRPDGIKLHMLHILRGSALGAIYGQKPFSLLSREEYVDIVCSQLRLLPETTVIERLTGDGASDTLIAPEWTKSKRAVLNLIDKTLAERNIWQGDSFGG